MQRLTLDQRIDRCSQQLGILLPNRSPAEAAQCAAQLVMDAYEYEPHLAAQIFARELPALQVDEINDYRSADPS